MILSKQNLSQIAAKPDLEKPEAAYFELPERVLQFGTGVLLRGLPDYFIDKANKAGIFNGRIVVVKSTSQGGTDAFASQDGLYTQCIRGIEDGMEIDRKVINASISRVLSAREEWDQVLACAANPDMQVVLSNTTEVGISLDKEDRVSSMPPASFPGKLLAFLLKRYEAFGGSMESGMVIVPTELIPDNGTLLKKVCLELAALNGLDAGFVQWLTEANDFCNSLVDRIVPGKLPEAEYKIFSGQYGYEDGLIIMSEAYRLWAIESSRPRTAQILSFSQADEGVVITGDIGKYRELKLRLLNGAHTLTCGLAVLSDFTTVRDAMANSFFQQFISGLMYDEIARTITGASIKEEDAAAFSGKVLDRFRNPALEHQWLAITAQFTSKMLMRNIPVLLAYYKRFKRVPKNMAIGFAAYILFMRSVKNEAGSYVGKLSGKEYPINDDRAALLHEKWKAGNIPQVVHAILSDRQLWEQDLSLLSGFEKAVTDTVVKFADEGSNAAWHNKKIMA